MGDRRYWFGISQNEGGPALLRGPYTIEDAINEIERTRAMDVLVTRVFIADSEEEAWEPIRKRRLRIGGRDTIRQALRMTSY